MEKAEENLSSGRLLVWGFSVFVPLKKKKLTQIKDGDGEEIWRAAPPAAEAWAGFRRCPPHYFLFMTPTVALVNYMYITGASCLKKWLFLEEKNPQIYIYNRIFLHTCIVVLNVFQYMWTHTHTRTHTHTVVSNVLIQLQTKNKSMHALCIVWPNKRLHGKKLKTCWIYFAHATLYFTEVTRQVTQVTA